MSTGRLGRLREGIAGLLERVRAAKGEVRGTEPRETHPEEKVKNRQVEKKRGGSEGTENGRKHSKKTPPSASHIQMVRAGVLARVMNSLPRCSELICSQVLDKGNFISAMIPIPLWAGGREL